MQLFHTLLGAEYSIYQNQPMNTIKLAAKAEMLEAAFQQVQLVVQGTRTRGKNVA